LLLARLFVCLFVVQYHELHFCCCCFCCLLICSLFTSIVFFFGLLVDLFVFISITYLVALVIVVVDLLLVVDDVTRANFFVFVLHFFLGGKGWSCYLICFVLTNNTSSSLVCSFCGLIICFLLCSVLPTTTQHRHCLLFCL
jgi:hypothetical protein